jgi:hypothetical protein
MAAYDLAQFKKAEVDPNEPMSRLLKCMKCRTIDEVPDYEGPEGGKGSAEFDIGLKFFTDQHVNKGCTREDFATYEYPTRFWVIPKIKEGIMAQINEGAQGLDVFGTNAYAMKENFSADAMTCWMTEHNQTLDCGDYKSDKKQLTAGTDRERISLGLEPLNKGPKVYLCDYCPMKSKVQGKYFKKKGY